MMIKDFTEKDDTMTLVIKRNVWIQLIITSWKT